ncbi:MAG TPA: hypothetical protein P5543_01195 [Planctomycetota bacterium]|nr:hypothetical protein [Planctomycetota bacterium]HRU50792.1 hypothetical protein [Planctomycetota bacterium]
MHKCVKMCKVKIYSGEWKSCSGEVEEICSGELSCSGEWKSCSGGRKVINV